jgi:RES domain-containing protein
LPRWRSMYSATPPVRGAGCVPRSGSFMVAVRSNSWSLKLARVSSRSSYTASMTALRPISLRTSGRWHTRGRRVVYCAQNPAAALLETLVHFEIDIQGLPTRYRLLKIEAPDDVHLERVPLQSLPADWPARTEVTRAVGDEWLTSGASALLSVPSAIVPETWNVLLNPGHHAAPRVVVVGIGEHAIDPRLLK